MGFALRNGRYFELARGPVVSTTCLHGPRDVGVLVLSKIVFSYTFSLGCKLRIQIYISCKFVHFDDPTASFSLLFMFFWFVFSKVRNK